MTVLRNNAEKGSALILALCLLALAALLTASSVVLSQISAGTSKTNYDRICSSYLAESAANRVIWMLMNDKKNNSNRSLGELNYEELEESRYLADGVTHKVESEDGVEVEFSINDMLSGMNISGSNPGSELQSLSNMYEKDPEKRETLLELTDKLLDYVDANDFVRLKGFEKVDYTNSGLAPLPRNRNMQFKEETLLIPGMADHVSVDENGRLGFFNIIPLEGMPKVSTRSSFFNAPEAIIKSRGKFSTEEIEEILKARNSWKNEKLSLSESLDPGTLAKLKSSFSFRESGCYTIIVKASTGKDCAKRTLIVSLKISNSVPDYGIRYYEYLLF
jgi:hypothetical protein